MNNITSPVAKYNVTYIIWSTINALMNMALHCELWSDC